MSIRFVYADNFLDYLFRPLGGLNVASFYDSYWYAIDFFLYLVVFLGAVRVSLEQKFPGRGGKALTVVLGIMLTISMTWIAKSIGFRVADLWPVAAGLFIGIIALLVFRLMAEQGAKIWKGTATAYVVTFLVVQAIMPELFGSWGWIATRMPIAWGIANMLFLVAIVYMIGELGRFFSHGRKAEGRDDWPIRRAEAYEEEPRISRGGEDRNGRHRDEGRGDNGNGDEEDDRDSTPEHPVPRRPTIDPRDPKWDPGSGTGPSSDVEPRRLPTVPEYKPMPLKPAPEQGVKIDLSPHFMPVKNQNPLPSCTAFAACGMLEYEITRKLGKRVIDLSEMFVFHHSSGFTKPVMDFIKKQGTCKGHIWKYIIQNANVTPPKEAYKDSQHQRVIDYRKLHHDRGETPSDAILRALLEELPVYVVIETNTFFGVYNGGLFTHGEEPHNSNGHAVIILGYDSHYPVSGGTTQAYKIRNSWGTRWGDRGYMWISKMALDQFITVEPPVVLLGWRGFSEFSKKSKKDDLKDLIEKMKKLNGDRIKLLKELKNDDVKFQKGEAKGGVFSWYSEENLKIIDALFKAVRALAVKSYDLFKLHSIAHKYPRYKEKPFVKEDLFKKLYSDLINMKRFLTDIEKAEQEQGNVNAVERRYGINDGNINQKIEELIELLETELKMEKV